MKPTLLSLGVVPVGLLALSLGISVSTASEDVEALRSDTLQARPLRILMVTLGQDMSRISDGIWHEDYEMIRAGARAIADHPQIAPEEMAAIKAALGERFASFVHFDQIVHGAAVEMADAAERHDIGHILEDYAKLQRNCVSCHAVFRKEVRETLY